MISPAWGDPGQALAKTAARPPILSLHFDQLPSEEVPPGFSLKIQGGSIIPQGVTGQAWRLAAGDFFSLDLKDKINTSEGTVILWVRPRWPNNDEASHTYLSLAWEGDKKGYFALSRGWWEPAGKQRTYFILNNQDYAHVSKPIEYEPDTWTQLACTWKAGNPGYLRLYVNGFRTAQSRYQMKTLLQPASPLYVGSDQGSPLAKNRGAECDLDELALFPTALTDEEIFALFARLKPSPSRTLKKLNGKVLETRAILDEGIGWTTEAGARKTIERIKKAGFNVYVPCVWHGGGTRYPSPKAPAARGFTILTTDPLKRLLDLAHQNGIEVHPWFCVALREGDILPEFYGPGTPDKAFDLHRPEFRAFMVDLILDVVQRYEVDGINLDYIRTMGLCRCEFCQKEYHRTTGRDL
ncbi:MAG: LamG-like jellyroll fold domain-containing protein, partial [Desulfobaccales bacterium]